MTEPITISILVIASINALVSIISAIKEDHFTSSCCTSKNGSNLFNLENNFKGQEVEKK